MNAFRFLGGLLVLTLVGSHAQAQATAQDRVISGNANLAILSKEANKSGIKDEALLKVLTSSKTNAIIVQERIVPGAGGTRATEHWLLYATGRETKFKEMKISKENYDWLIKWRTRSTGDDLIPSPKHERTRTRKETRTVGIGAIWIKER